MYRGTVWKGIKRVFYWGFPNVPHLHRDLRVSLGPSELENLLADVPSVGTIVMEEIVKTQNVETQNVKEE